MNLLYAYFYFQSFRAVVDKAGLAACKRKPVEFLVDRFLGLVEEKEIQIFQVCLLFSNMVNILPTDMYPNINSTWILRPNISEN